MVTGLQVAFFVRPQKLLCICPLNSSLPVQEQLSHLDRSEEQASKSGQYQKSIWNSVSMVVYHIVQIYILYHFLFHFCCCKARWIVKSRLKQSWSAPLENARNMCRLGRTFKKWVFFCNDLGDAKACLWIDLELALLASVIWPDNNCLVWVIRCL